MTLALAAALLVALGAPRARGDEILEKYQDTVKKGLEWLAKQQARDGSWSANGQYQVSMTALAGMALLCEGSTVQGQGKYAEHLRKATDWLMDKAQKAGGRDGLIGNPDSQSDMNRYMYGHGFATLFLACVYGDENNAQKREKLKDILTRSAKYIINAQSSKGGFFYTSKADGGDRDEGSVTITQVQALRACRNAGIPVPRDVIKKAQDYLKECTSPKGHVYYSFQSKSERPALTAAAIACGFNAGDYKSELVKKWFKACREAIPPQLGGGAGGAFRLGHDEYTHYYYAQSIYILGDNGWEKLFGATPEADRLTWTKYRNSICDQLKGMQNADGSWPAGGGFGSVGPVYTTSLYLTIMQLDRGILPIYQR
jgi:hypothetical protein